VSWWQDLVDKIKDAIAPDPPPPARGTDQQHGAPLAPDPEAPTNTGVADPNDPGNAPTPPPPDQPYRNQEIGDAGAPPAGSSSIPGGMGTEPSTGAGMTDEVAPAVGTLAAGFAVASGVLAGAAPPDAGPDLPDPDAIGAGPGDPSGMGMG
jgi:hypothetical protein